MTGTVPIDLSKLPPSKYGDDVWFSMLLPDEIGKLRRLHEAIGKWRIGTDAEFDDFKRQCDQNRNPVWDEYGYDPVQDEAFMLLETERVMLANLGVSIASTAENLIVGICKSRNVNALNNFGITDFGIACQSLGNSLKIVLSKLPGYDGNQRARMLGNCFKHSEGKTNQKFVEKYGGDLGMTIEYEKEDWLGMIADTQTMLTEIISRLKPEQKS